jgi:hypothetical protein
MLSAAIHRKWAREFLARAQGAPSRARKVKYLRLAVSHSVRAQTVEVETAPAESTGVDAQKRGES